MKILIPLTTIIKMDGLILRRLCSDTRLTEEDRVRTETTIFSSFIRDLYSF